MQLQIHSMHWLPLIVSFAGFCTWYSDREKTNSKTSDFSILISAACVIAILYIQTLLS